MYLNATDIYNQRKCAMKNIFICLFSFLILFIGCSKKDDVVKIGIINSLTGSAAPYGKNAQMGFDLAIEEVNNKMGINGKRLQAITEDDQTLPELAVSSFNKLISVEESTCNNRSFIK